MGELRILGPHNLSEMDFIPPPMRRAGDNRIQWDPKNKDEVEIARLTFDKAKEKGHQAFEVKKDGSKGKKITRFKPSLGMIIMIPAVAGG